MIIYLKGDIFESGAEAIVNPVNCMGIMGKGLALQFKNKFPKTNIEYTKFCNEGKLLIGTLHHNFENNIHIINFPTKIEWFNKSKMEYISKGLDVLIELIIHTDIHSIAIPALGCGLGGLNWIEIKSLLHNKLTVLSTRVNIYVYEPN